ncbi:hypothetical protein ST47_g1379 [Ascochyta rabiei]|uniref:Apple domain-containing protein n=1 Tax=Didymella rabiei TaxID=5454 RepID=A0A163L578_DIDRA|nr:hypothetical protein ST47_g1379 [Ascochyta rabiei]
MVSISNVTHSLFTLLSLASFASAELICGTLGYHNETNLSFFMGNFFYNGLTSFTMCAAYCQQDEQCEAFRHSYWDDADAQYCEFFDTSLKKLDKDKPQHTSSPRDLLAMREGDPNERIDVPFVHSHDHKSALDYLRFRNVGKVTRRVIARPMTRRLYNERYAHDQNGNFIGTGVKAPDAGLVFIPGKGTEQDLLDQVSKFAHAKQHDPRDFADGYGTTLIDGGHVGS